MITIKPIEEPDVLSLLNRDRFDGPLEGYIMTDGNEYLGYCLFVRQDAVTRVLDAEAQENMMLDGLVRAAVAKGENEGASAFSINREIPALGDWAAVFVPGQSEPIENSRIFGNCG